MKHFKLTVTLASLSLLSGCLIDDAVPRFSVSGSISGLAGTVVLQTGDSVKTFTTNGTKTLSTPIPSGTAYAVTVKTQPTGQVCTVTNGTGTVLAEVTNVAVNCVSTTRNYATVSTYVNAAAAQFSNAEGIAVDSAGVLYVADMINNRIRKIATDGTVTTLAGTTTPGSLNGTGAAASFSFPQSVATDADGNVYVADTSNHLIRKITPAGVVTTVAGIAGSAGHTNGPAATAKFNSPSGIATDTSGNLYVADANNNLIRKISAAGEVTTLAGPGSLDATGAPAPAFNSPRALVVDPTGVVYVSDSANNMIRKITPAGVVTTLAGSTTAGNADGNGTAATFNFPHGIALDASGNIYVVSNDRVRKITPAGEVTTVTGTATGVRVDGTLAAAVFGGTQSLTIDANGVIYVLEIDDVRKIE